VAGEANVVADQSADILTLVEGTGIDITTSAALDSITFTNSAPMKARSAVSGSTLSIANDTRVEVNIAGAKGYALYKIETSAAARVTVYTDTASRIADAGRAFSISPSANSGVITDIETSGAEIIKLGPGVIGYNNESSPTTNIPIAITNKSGVVATITVNLTITQLEL
jgi:hypothetical protein